MIPVSLCNHFKVCIISLRVTAFVFWSSIFNYVHIWVCAWVYAHEQGACWGQKTELDLLELPDVSAGTKLRSSVRAASVLSCWAISTALPALVWMRNRWYISHSGSILLSCAPSAHDLATPKHPEDPGYGQLFSLLKMLLPSLATLSFCPFPVYSTISQKCSPITIYSLPPVHPSAGANLCNHIFLKFTHFHMHFPP